MPYDPATVINRYKQMLDTPEGEPTESSCTRARTSGLQHDTLGCEPGGCQSCCIGLVEVVRQYSEQQVELEARSIEFDDIQTKAAKLVRE